MTNFRKQDNDIENGIKHIFFEERWHDKHFECARW